MFPTNRRASFLVFAFIGAMSGFAASAAPLPTSRDELYRAAIALWQKTEPPAQTYGWSGAQISSRTEQTPPSKDSPQAANYRRIGELASAFVEAAQRDGVKDNRANQLLYIGGLAAYSGSNFERARVLLEKLLADGSYRRFYFPRNPASEPPPSRSPAAGIRRLLLELSLKSAPEKAPDPLAAMKAATEAARGVAQAEREHQRQLDSLNNPHQRELLKYLDESAPQPDARRANALPETDTLVAAAWDKYLPGAVAKSGGKAVRDWLREEAKPGAAFQRIAANRLVNLDQTIIAQYQAEYRKYLAAHNFDAARGRLKLIAEEYKDTDAARQAEAELPKLVPIEVQFFKSSGDAAFQPSKKIGVPQKEAADFFRRAFQADEKGPQAAYALLKWNRALATEGKLTQAIGGLKKLLNDFPDAKEEGAEAKYLIGFYLGHPKVKKYNEAMEWMARVVKEDGGSPFAPEALYQAGLWAGWNSNFETAIPLLQQLVQKYPNSPRVRWANAYVQKFQEKLKAGEKWS